MAVSEQLQLKTGSRVTPRLSMRQRQGLVGLLLISPWLIGLIFLKIAPIIASLVISFTNFYALEPGQTQFVGFANYLRFLTDIDAGASLFGTVSLAITTVPVQLLAALAFATLLNSKRLRAKGLLRVIFFLPAIIPAIATFFVAFGFLDPTSGWLYLFILKPLGLPPAPGLFSEAGFNFFLMLMAVWAIGPNFLIMLGAMQGIPTELYEAARVDGAGPLYRFFRITIPMISPAIFFALIISLVTIFGGAALLDQGTTFGQGISPYDNYIGFIMFDDFDYGYASSLAWLFLVLVLGFIYTLFRTSRYWVHYADFNEGDHTL
jgi:multiple sugar transport system permease protein